MKNYKPKDGHVLILRTNDKNNQSRGDFQYPTKGYVEAPDWEATNECGFGLHGALKGVGNGCLFNWNNDAIWMVLEVKESEIINLGDKVKFKGGNIVYSGTRQEATKLLYDVYRNVGIIGLDYHSDKKEMIVGGYYSTLTGGYNSTLTGGNESILSGDFGSTLIGGNYSTLTGGDYSTLTGGNWSTLIGGNRSTLTGGIGSTLSGGDNSVLRFKYWDESRDRIKTYYVGENGVKPNTKYRLNGNFEIEEVK